MKWMDSLLSFSNVNHKIKILIWCNLSVQKHINDEFKKHKQQDCLFKLKIM